MTRHYVFVALTAVGCFLACQSAQAQTHEEFRVGTIDFFGGQGMDTAGLLVKLPLHIGQKLEFDEADQTKQSVSAAVLAFTGKPSTDVNIVCCDQPGKLGIYIGLQGKSYRASEHTPAPAGEAKLPDDGVALYKRDMDANVSAVQRGNAGEDDSKGYALTRDPANQKIQSEMRDYALKHTADIERVLHASEDAEQRQAAAMLLGYSERSAEQLKALILAADDTDDEVRNNAIRALKVLAAAKPLVDLNPAPFVAMLYSGSWTDRNKSSLLLDRLTLARDPVLLEKLRQQAMGPLLDGAMWQSAGHAEPFLAILGRIGKIDDTRLQRLIESGAKAEIIAAAMKR